MIDLALLTTVGGFSMIGCLEWQSSKGTGPCLSLHRQKSVCRVLHGQYLLGLPSGLCTGHTAGGAGDIHF